MCIHLGAWLTNNFQVTNIHLSLQAMVFTMSEKKNRVDAVCLFLFTLLTMSMLLLGMTFMIRYNKQRNFQNEFCDVHHVLFYVSSNNK